MKNKCNFTDRELLDCPFCENEFSQVVTLSYYHRELGRLYFVECQKCGATSRHSDVVDSVVDAWNKRGNDTCENYDY